MLAVCAHLPGGCDRPRLLDGPFPSGSGTGSHGVPRPQYPLLTSGTSPVVCRCSSYVLFLISEHEFLLTSFKFIFTFDRDIHTKKFTVVTNNINNDRLPFRSPSSKALILFLLTRWNDLLELSHH